MSKEAKKARIPDAMRKTFGSTKEKGSDIYTFTSKKFAVVKKKKIPETKNIEG